MLFGDPAVPTTRGTLNGDLSNLLADEELTFWTAEDRAGYINKAYRRMNEMFKPITQYTSLIVPPLTSGVPMPSDFMGLAAGGLAWAFSTSPDDVQPLQRRGVPELDREYNGWQTSGAGSGDPMYYHLEPQNPTNNTAILVPTPSASGLLYIEYNPFYPDMVSATDQPWGGSWSGFHHLIPLLAESYARQKEQDFQAEQTAIARWKLEIPDFMRSLAEYAPSKANTLLGNSYRLTFRPGGY